MKVPNVLPNVEQQKYVLKPYVREGGVVFLSESTTISLLFAVHCCCGPFLPQNTTLITTALHVRVVRPNKIAEQSTSGLNTKYKSKQALFHFGFRAQQNPLIKKVIRVNVKYSSGWGSYLMTLLLKCFREAKQ